MPMVYVPLLLLIHVSSTAFGGSSREEGKRGLTILRFHVPATRLDEKRDFMLIQLFSLVLRFPDRPIMNSLRYRLLSCWQNTGCWFESIRLVPTGLLQPENLISSHEQT